jgi:lysozyme family protein
MTNKKIVWGGTAGVAAAVSLMLTGIYEREGGYVDHVADRGGKTNHGVTEAVARTAGYKGHMKTFPKHCETEKDVCADKIYYQTYIEGPGLVPLIKADPAVADELYDTATNMGPAWPGRFLQASLNELCPIGPKLKVDGKIGPGTQTRFVQCQTNIGKVKFCKSMLEKLDSKQLARYDYIVSRNKSQKVFYKGWKNHRINNVNRKRCDAQV